VGIVANGEGFGARPKRKFLYLFVSRFYFEESLKALHD